MELAALKKRDQFLHGGMPESAGSACEHVPLPNDWHEVQLELARGRLNSKTDIRDATGYKCGYRSMRKFSTFVPLDQSRIYAVGTEQSIQQNPRPRPGLSIHKAESATRQVGNRLDIPRIPFWNYQPLRSKY